MLLSDVVLCTLPGGVVRAGTEFSCCLYQLHVSLQSRSASKEEILKIHKQVTRPTHYRSSISYKGGLMLMTFIVQCKWLWFILIASTFQ